MQSWPVLMPLGHILEKPEKEKNIKKPNLCPSSFFTAHSSTVVASPEVLRSYVSNKTYKPAWGALDCKRVH
jgi:hypothetical protein